MPVGAVCFSPFTRTATRGQFSIAGSPHEATPLLTIESLTASLSNSSLVRRAPVIEALRAQGRHAHAVRVAADLFSFSDRVDPATVKISDAERPASIARVYGDEKIPDQPRNVIGIAKTIAASEMEKRILSTIAVGDGDLRKHANGPAAALRDRLEAPGQGAARAHAPGGAETERRWHPGHGSADAGRFFAKVTGLAA